MCGLQIFSPTPRYLFFLFMVSLDDQKLFSLIYPTCLFLLLLLFLLASYSQNHQTSVKALVTPYERLAHDSLISHQNQEVWGTCLLGSSHKSCEANMCTNSFQGNTGDLEPASGRRKGKFLQAPLVFSDDHSKPLDVC